MRKHRLHHAWLILAAYGVWFAVFSGIEELTHGKWWKFVLSLVFGLVTYLVIETKFKS